MASLTQLKQLAEHLSPGLKVAEPEVASIVSALVQVIQHGEGLVAAAEQGAQAVADFYHDVIVQDAVARGVPPEQLPQKGAPVQTVTGPVSPVPVASGTPVTADQVAAIVQQAIAGALAGHVTVAPTAEPPAGT